MTLCTAAASFSASATPTSSAGTGFAYGAQVTFTSTVSGTGGPPTGTVTFYDNGVALGTATLSAGAASVATKAVGAGTRSITATYNPSGSFASSTSGVLTQTVSAATGTGAVGVSLATPQYSDPDTFTATYTPGTSGWPCARRAAR